ncbi:MAG TPA: serine/threonine-protein kinase [Ktedonobacteraceae bacterium]
MQQDPLIGATLGNYKILAPLGQGGMARVYRAIQENLGREVAVKVLPPWYAADRSFVDRFNLEAKMVAGLSHPNIVTIHDFSEQNGHLYIVMQLVDGGTLKQLIDALPVRQGGSKSMDLKEVNAIFKQLADALSFAHRKGIIHRDIKPVNVLMDQGSRPILSDFGIAKVMEGTKELTRPGAGVGTPEYMSPEQCKGENVDARADIYALGIMLFECLTGRTPFLGDNYTALAHSQIYDDPPDPRRFNQQIPAAVCDVILIALQKKPEFRYQRATSMADALDLAVKAPGVNLDPNASGFYRNPGSSQIVSRSVERVPTNPLYACPHCQRPNSAEMRYCTGCRYQLNPCSNCHFENRVRDRFCTRCGQPLTALRLSR